MSLMLKVNPWPRYIRRLVYKAHALSPEELQASAMVFAPHQDDETLGCGGTIIKKRAAGAPVHVVFMTDGSRSHAHLLPEDELRSIRQQEAQAACQTLGVDQEDISFLDYKDQNLQAQRAAALERVAALLKEYAPASVFIPYHGDPPPDHLVTNQIVREALRQQAFPTQVYEYPVWAWYHWPRLSLPLSLDRASLRLARNTFNLGFGRRARRELTCAVYVEDVLDQKRAALDEHKSQMTPLRPGADWSTLETVSDGEFLACFLQPYELYFCYQIKPV